jgi:hypothetical protein
MAARCRCVTGVWSQHVCQTLFHVRGVSHQCSRQAGHEEGRHRADVCDTEAPEKVLTVRHARTITFACPHCGRPVPFNPVKVEDGFVDLDTLCPNAACGRRMQVALGSLGGYIWPAS